MELHHLDELHASVQDVMVKIEGLRRLYLEGQIEKERKKLDRLTQLKNSALDKEQEDRKSVVVEDIRRRDGFDTRAPPELEDRGPHTPPRKREREDSEDSRRHHKRRHNTPPPGEEPSVDCSIFVSEIPRRVSNEELKRVFSQVGPVYEATIVTQKATGASKGFGFVRFFGMDDVKKALDMQAPEFEDDSGRRRQVKIRLADPKNALEITGMPRNWTIEEIEEEIKRRGEAPIERIEALPNGGVFVAFKDHDTALGVMRSLQGTTIADTQLSINLTESRNKERPDQTSKILFVRGIAPTVDEVELERLFGLDVIDRVQIPKDRETRQPLGHAFVHFKTREDAEDALVRFENYELHSRRFHLNWSMAPKQRPRHFADSYRPGRNMNFGRRDGHFYHEDDRRYDRGGY